MNRKYLFTFLMLTFLTVNSYSTTYTSAANGNWMNFMTWSPFGVPIPGDIVIINHDVVMDTALAYTSGSVTVNVGASLTQDVSGRDIWLNGVGASLTNHGTITMRNMLLSAGTFNNSGILTFNSAANFITMNNPGGINCIDSLYNDGTIDNNGVINVVTFYNNNLMNNYGTIQGLSTVVDSLWNEGDFFNFLGATLLADSATNNGNFTNNGTIQFFQFTNFVNGVFVNDGSLSFTDMTNMGDFTNNSTIIGSNSMWNNEVFNNTSTGQITLTNSFLNADSIANTAVFNNYGSVDIGDSFYNFNVVNGTAPGSFTVQDSSFNSGVMTESYDFCDATPPLSAPYIDINLGTVDPLITYCATTGIIQNEFTSFTIYPNPTKGIVYVGGINQYVEVYDVLGKQILKDYTNQINIGNYQSGLYFLIIKDQEGDQLYKEKLIKQ